MLSRRALLAGLCLTLVLPRVSIAQNEDLDRVVGKGLEYLQKSGQADDGTFSIKAGPGVTALVVTAMLRNKVPLSNPSLAKGLKALEGFVKPDGGVYGNGRLMNYETCVSVLAFAEANKVAGDGRYDEILAKAKTFLTSLQYGEAAGESATDPNFGGVGYAGKGRPDLSNTTYLLEALHSLDTSSSDPAIQRALVFVSRCQNLKSEHNDNELAAKVNDGGFFYTIPTEKEVESIDKNSAMGGLRSYGSMTYSGFKSMIYAGLSKEDTRVKAAQSWIAKHYSVTENPGMGKAGLYYYYHTFGAALNASGLKSLTTSDGVDRNWKQELIKQLGSTQQSDGSWQNENRQWFEDDKNLATAFALLSLAYCRE